MRVTSKVANELAQIRREKRLAREAQAKRIAEAHATAQRIVAGGVCPDCGAPLRRNLALTGWYQCSQFGAESFRADPSRPSCNFQCFTE